MLPPGSDLEASVHLRRFSAEQLSVSGNGIESGPNHVGIALRDRPLTETRRSSQLVESPDYTNHLSINAVDNTNGEPHNAGQEQKSPSGGSGPVRGDITWKNKTSLRVSIKQRRRKKKLASHRSDRSGSGTTLQQHFVTAMVGSPCR